VVLFAYEYVDFSSMVDEEFLERLGIEKGREPREEGSGLARYGWMQLQAASGGSLSNSLVALARLGNSRADSYPDLRIAMAGSVGSDPLGSFYR
jgi:sugar/nucleoside kinase (ribokinase family)